MQAGDPLRDRGAGAGFAFAPHSLPAAAAPPLLRGPPLLSPDAASQQPIAVLQAAAVIASSSPPPQPSAPPATPHELNVARLQQPPRRAEPARSDEAAAAEVAAPSPRGPPRLSVAVSVEGVDAKGALAVPVAAAAALSLLPAEVAGEDDAAASAAMTAPSPIVGSSTLPGRQVSSVGPLRLAAAATDAVAADEAEAAESCSEEALPPREAPLQVAAAAVGRMPPRHAAVLSAAASGAAESPPDPLLSPSSSLLVAPTLDDVGLPSRATVSWADEATAEAAPAGSGDAPFAATRTAGTSLIESALAALALSRAIVDGGDAPAPSSGGAERRSYPANSTAPGAPGGRASAAAAPGTPLTASAAVANAEGVGSLWGSRAVCEGEAAAAAACSGGYAMALAAASPPVPEDRQSGSGDDDDDEEEGGSQGLMFLSADPAPTRGGLSSSTHASLLPAALVPPTAGSLAVSYRGRLLQVRMGAGV